MEFTALHRLLGRAPEPLTDHMVNEAVAQNLSETRDLDWKSELPPAKGITQTDFPKDIAAMANSGGGTIVYGVEESNKVAVGRRDVGDLDEGHERALRSAAVTAISPPVFNLGIHRLGPPGNSCIAVVVPPSVDGPHLIYRGEYFGAPIRNDADTVWMRERQIEAMYRARFDERRHATEALANLYAEAAQGRDTDTRAWLIAIAHPRIPAAQQTRLTRDEARGLFERGAQLSATYANHGTIHPLTAVDGLNPRTGLRRWIAPNTLTSDSLRWRQAHASIHDDGSVVLTTAIGGEPNRQGGYWPGEYIDSAAIESAIADLFSLIRAVSTRLGTTEYEVRVGIESTGNSPLVIQTLDTFGRHYEAGSTPLPRYSPVDATVNAISDDASYLTQIHELARDCVNQGGVSNLRMIRPPSQ